MKARTMIMAGLGVAVIAGAVSIYLSGMSRITMAGFVLNTVRSRDNPLGTLVLENRGTAQTSTLVEDAKRRRRCRRLAGLQQNADI
jgi:hypothetical protein